MVFRYGTAVMATIGGVSQRNKRRFVVGERHAVWREKEREKGGRVDVRHHARERDLR